MAQTAQTTISETGLEAARAEYEAISVMVRANRLSPEAVVQMALWIEVRGYIPHSDDPRIQRPCEYRIQLCGGVRVAGELNRNEEPVTAILESREGTSWNTVIGCDKEILLAFARCF